MFKSKKHKLYAVTWSNVSCCSVLRFFSTMLNFFCKNVMLEFKINYLLWYCFQQYARKVDSSNRCNRKIFQARVHPMSDNSTNVIRRNSPKDLKEYQHYTFCRVCLYEYSSFFYLQRFYLQKKTNVKDTIKLFYFEYLHSNLS